MVYRLYLTSISRSQDLSQNQQLQLAVQQHVVAVLMGDLQKENPSIVCRVLYYRGMLLCSEDLSN